MRKLFTVLLVLLMTFPAIGLAALEADDIIGIWYLHSMMLGEIIMDTSASDTEMTMTFHEDNTMVMDSGDGEGDAGTWTISGDQLVMTADGEDIPLALENGKLVLSLEGVEMVYGRETAAPLSIEIAPTKSDATLSDFNGTWNAYLADSYSMKQHPYSLLGDNWGDFTLTVEEGKATITAFSKLNKATEMEGEVVDGVLTFGYASADEGAPSMAFSLHEDGTMRCVYDENVTVYLEKTDEQ